MSYPACCTGTPLRPEHIFINGGENKAPIDIMRVFCLDQEDPAYKLADTLKEIVLPPDVYPPEWDKRTIVLDEIIRQAALQGTQLIKDSSKGKTWTKGGEKSQLLRCKYARTYYQPTSAGGARKTQEDLYHNEGLNVDKPGIQEDQIVTKDKAWRGLNGKELEHCAQTEKPPLEFTCPFQIKVTLVRDKHFVLRTAFHQHASHNHYYFSTKLGDMIVFQRSSSCYHPTRRTSPWLLQACERRPQEGNDHEVVSS